MEEAYADVVVFDTALQKGNENLLPQAIAVYRGPLLEGCTEDWILTEREQRAQAYLTAVETLAETLQRRQEYAQAAHYFRLVISEDALRETAQRGLMRVQAESGNIAAATQSYREFRQRLHRDMNTEPDPETIALYHQLRENARINPRTAASTLTLQPPRDRLPEAMKAPEPLMRYEAIQLFVERAEHCRFLESARNARLPAGRGFPGGAPYGRSELLYESVDIRLLPKEEADRQEAKTRAIRQLGDAEVKALWTAGRGLSSEEAIALAKARLSEPYQDAPLLTLQILDSSNG